MIWASQAAGAALRAAWETFYAHCHALLELREGDLPGCVFRISSPAISSILFGHVPRGTCTPVAAAPVTRNDRARDLIASPGTRMRAKAATLHRCKQQHRNKASPGASKAALELQACNQLRRNGLFVCQGRASGCYTMCPSKFITSITHRSRLLHVSAAHMRSCLQGSIPAIYFTFTVMVWAYWGP